MTAPPASPARADALAVVLRLREQGHVAYFAGGCVRDELLGQAPQDFDVATDAPPPRVRKLFPRTQAVGAAFGVILVRQNQHAIEVATFRTDGAYRDGRRPDAVVFTTAEEDAKRRDFTINGLFLDPVQNRVIDYVGGQADLAARVVRAIGDADGRFTEDHLRLLRAVRFASRMGFGIEPTTAAAIRRHAHQLPRISPERVAEELRKMLTASTRNTAWRTLAELGLTQQVFRMLVPLASPRSPSLFEQFHSPGSGATLAAAALDVQLSSERTVHSSLDRIAVRKAVQAMRQSLKISNDESAEMEGVLLGAGAMLSEPPPGVARMKRFLATPTASAARELLRAIAAAGLQEAAIHAVEAQLAELAAGEVAPPPLLSGDDLTAAGATPGPGFKRALDAVYDAQLEGRLSDRAAALELGLQIIGT